MGSDDVVLGPLERLADLLALDLEAVDALIRDRMASQYAPRIPALTAHLVEAGGKRLRPMLTLAAARLFGHDGPFHVHLAASVEFIHTATLLHDDVVDESQRQNSKVDLVLPEYAGETLGDDCPQSQVTRSNRRMFST